MGPDKDQAVMNHRHDDKRPKAGRAYGELGPMDDIVYVKPDLIEEKTTEGGTYVPKPKLQGAPNTGTVLAVGKNIKTVFVNDKVVFNDPNAKGFWLNDIAHIPIKEEQIIAIIGSEL